MSILWVTKQIHLYLHAPLAFKMVDVSLQLHLKLQVFNMLL